MTAPMVCISLRRLEQPGIDKAASNPNQLASVPITSQLDKQHGYSDPGSSRERPAAFSNDITVPATCARGTQAGEFIVGVCRFSARRERLRFRRLWTFVEPHRHGSWPQRDSFRSALSLGSAIPRRAPKHRLIALTVSVTAPQFSLSGMRHRISLSSRESLGTVFFKSCEVDICHTPVAPIPGLLRHLKPKHKPQCDL
jgi:hypothetical protein